MSCNCSSYSVVDGSVNQTEYTAKAYQLQCLFKDYVSNLTNKWRYGIFCPEDCDKMVEARALLRLLIEYGVETVVTEEALALPECYQDFLDANGTDLTVLSNLPTPLSINDYFLMRDPNTNQYWVLKGTAGYYTGQAGNNAITTSNILQTLITGIPFIQIGINPDSPDFYIMNVECNGVLSELEASISNSNGIEVTTSGIPSSDIIKIVERLEKILSC